MNLAITAASATDLLARLESREVSAVELAGAFLDRIHNTDPAIGAFLSVDAEGARSSTAS